MAPEKRLHPRRRARVPLTPRLTGPTFRTERRPGMGGPRCAAAGQRHSLWRLFSSPRALPPASLQDGPAMSAGTESTPTRAMTHIRSSTAGSMDVSWIVERRVRNALNAPRNQAPRTRLHPPLNPLLEGGCTGTCTRSRSQRILRSYGQAQEWAFPSRGRSQCYRDLWERVGAPRK
jgi:hypothetical protein